MNPTIFKQIIKIDVSKLPAYSGIEDGQGGYALLRVSRVVVPEKVEPDREKGLVSMLQQAIGAEQFAAYVGSLKQKTGVKIRQEVLLEKKEDASQSAPTVPSTRRPSRQLPY
jgi:peptidyl-prolyl cis-trans isomerase D